MRGASASRYLPIAALIALFLAIAGSVNHPIGGYGVETDFYWDYAPAARGLLEGRIEIERFSFRGPGYPAMLAAASLGCFDLFSTAKVLSLLCGASSLFLLFLIVRKRLGDGWGVAASGLAVINGVFLEYSIRAGTDMPFLALNLLFLWLLDQDYSCWRGWSLGAVAGFAFLTRYNGAVLGFALALWSVYRLWNEGASIRREVGKVWLTLGLIVLPWLLILWVKTGDPFHNLNSQNLRFAVEGEGKAPWDRFWYPTASEESPAPLPSVDAAGVGRTMLHNLPERFGRIADELSGRAIMGLALAGAVFAATKSGAVGSWNWMLLVSLLHYLLLSGFFFSSRFYLPVFAGLISISLLSVVWIYDRMKVRRRALGLIWVGCVLLLMLIDTPQTIGEFRREFDDDPVEILPFVASIKDDVINGVTIAARKPHFPYLAGGRFVPLPRLQSLTELTNWMRSERMEYLYLNEREAIQRPALWTLLERPSQFPGLQVIAHFPEPKQGLWRLNSSIQ